MTESWDHRHGNGTAKHKLRRRAENKTGICGKPRLTQLQGRSDIRDAPIGQERFVFKSWPFAPTWETLRGGWNWRMLKDTLVCSPTDAADLRLLYIKTNKQFPPGKNFRKVLADVTLCLWFQGFILLESEKCFLGLALCVFISLEGVKGGATLFLTAG